MEKEINNGVLTRSPRRLFGIGVACLALWLLSSLVWRAMATTLGLSVEDGIGADIAWLLGTLIALVGMVAIALGVRATFARRR